MKVGVFSTQPYDKEFLVKANSAFNHELVFFESRLKEKTLPLAKGMEAVCVFVNDELNETVVKGLAELGVKLIALRSAGFNNVDLCAAYCNKIRVARVPAYSPHGVAEHAVALMLALNRKLTRGVNRVREGNFALDGLLGFEIYRKKVGVIGTGKIGQCFAKIMLGFGAEVLAYDVMTNPELVQLGVKYVPLEKLFKESDIISLHIPLLPETHHMINTAAIKNMKRGVMIINTSRGGLIDTAVVIEALKTGQIGSLALDVYEEEANLFFQDLSNEVIQDDVFARLLTFPNVLITGHQAFFTDTALLTIAETTLRNISDFANGKLMKENEVSCEKMDKQKTCGQPCGH